MTEIGDQLERERSGSLRDLASQVVDEHLVADAPPDCDEVMEKIPVYIGWMRVVVLAAASIGAWALIIAGAVAVRRALRHP